MIYLIGGAPRCGKSILAKRFGYPYVDMSDDFPSRLRQAEALLTAGAAELEQVDQIIALEEGRVVQ